MYPHELQEFISSRNYELNREELLQVIDVKTNSQLTYVKYNPWNNSYEMSDRYGNYYNFKCKGENI